MDGPVTPLCFPCEGERLGGWLHPGEGHTGIVIVQGGGQTRFGPHRLFARLAGELAAAGHPVLRFDRRGIGDSGGTDAGFERSGPDIAAALTALRDACPRVEKTMGIGLCDGATSLLLAKASFDRLVLLNPWAIEEQGAPSAGADRAHYARRLRQPGNWRRLLTGKVNPFPAIGALVRPGRPTPLSPLEARVRTALNGLDYAPLIVLSDRDRTAAHFAATAGKGIPARSLQADHAFSRQAEFRELSALLNVEAAKP